MRMARPQTSVNRLFRREIRVHKQPPLRDYSNVTYMSKRADVVPMELTLKSFLADEQLSVMEELHFVLFTLSDYMTVAGLDYMIFALETCKTDC